jgi:CheY-like chemotaxis protein
LHILAGGNRPAESAPVEAGRYGNALLRDYSKYTIDWFGVSADAEQFLLSAVCLVMKAARKIPIVLVAEDETQIRRMSVFQLEDAGYRVFEANGADQALAILESGVAIDVLFTDVNMPGGIDGVALARLVRQRWPHVHLIVTSGKTDIPLDELPEDGRFIRKPYRLSEMSDMVGEMTGAH